MKDMTNEELADRLEAIAAVRITHSEDTDGLALREAAARLRQQSEDSARLDALHAMVNGNVDGVEIRQDFAGPGQCLIVKCQNFYGSDIRSAIDRARRNG